MIRLKEYIVNSFVHTTNPHNEFRKTSAVTWFFLLFPHLTTSPLLSIVLGAETSFYNSTWSQQSWYLQKFTHSCLAFSTLTTNAYGKSRSSFVSWEWKISLNSSLSFTQVYLWLSCLLHPISKNEYNCIIDTSSIFIRVRSLAISI